MSLTISNMTYLLKVINQEGVFDHLYIVVTQENIHFNNLPMKKMLIKKLTTSRLVIRIVENY